MPVERLLACLLAVAALGAGCSDDDTSPAAARPDATTAPSTTAAPTTTTTETTIGMAEPLTEVHEAFEAQWYAFIEVLGDPDPENPLIDQHFTGEARKFLLDRIDDYLSEGKVARLPDDPSNFRPRIVGSRLDSPTEATVFECTIDGSIVVDRSTGEVLNDSIDLFEAKNEFELEDGVWKVTSTKDAKKDEPGCDALDDDDEDEDGD